MGKLHIFLRELDYKLSAVTFTTFQYSSNFEQWLRKYLINYNNSW